MICYTFQVASTHLVAMFMHNKIKKYYLRKMIKNYEIDHVQKKKNMQTSMCFGVERPLRIKTNWRTWLYCRPDKWFDNDILNDLITQCQHHLRSLPTCPFNLFRFRINKVNEALWHNFQLLFSQCSTINLFFVWTS